MTERLYFPMYVDLSEKHVLVIGTGSGAKSRIHALIPFAGSITVAAPETDPELSEMERQGLVRIICRPYDREDLYGCDICIAASNDRKVNEDAYAACKCLGIPVHVCGDKTKCDFFFSENAGEENETPESAEAGSEQPLVRIYTDGAARGNPNGPGGYAAVLEYSDSAGQLHVRELSQGYEKTTNNRMELMAAIAGLEALKKPCSVELYSDSKYLTDAINQGWVSSWEKHDWTRGKQKEPVKNIQLWKRLLRAMQPHDVSFIWVKGHAGHRQNERCDQLATEAADHGPYIPDLLDEME